MAAVSIVISPEVGEYSWTIISEVFVDLLHCLQQGDGHVVVTSLVKDFSFEIYQTFLACSEKTADELIRDNGVQLQSIDEGNRIISGDEYRLISVADPKPFWKPSASAKRKKRFWIQYNAVVDLWSGYPAIPEYAYDSTVLNRKRFFP